MPKTCSRCGLEKPLRDFYKQAGGAHGRRGACKECFKAAQRVAWAQDPKGSGTPVEDLERSREEELKDA